MRRRSFARSTSARRAAAPVAVAVAALLLGVAATPAGATHVGVGEDPAGDAASPHPAHDITGAALAYDRRRGALVGSVRLRGVATAATEGVLTLFAGRRTATGCDGYPAQGLSTFTASFRASWHVFPAPGEHVGGGVDRAEKSGERTTVQRMEATDRRLAGGTPDCAIATLTQPGDASVVLDTTGPIALRPVPVLGAALRGVPSRLRPGRTARVRVLVTNAGDAPTGRIRLRVAGARGLRVSPSTRTLAPLAAGRTRTATLRVRLSTRARASTRLRVTATAGDQRVRTEGRIRLLRPSSGGGGGGGGSTPPRTCNRWMPDISGETGGSLVLVPC
jgi:hypothetical protein